MNDNHKIEQKVNEVMNSLDGLTRAKANPFLFTRVEARLRRGGKNAWETAISYISRPAVALAMLSMVILSNAVVMYWRAGAEEAAMEQQVALTEEYNLSVSSFYDEENPEP